MATAAKPDNMAKAAKPDTAQATDTPVPPKKGKKKLIIAIVTMLLLLGGGAAAFLLLIPSHAPKLEVGEIEAPVMKQVAYVELGTFTANLIQEEGDRYLQASISLKITKPELTQKIKDSNPEILHRVNMLLQSKRPSELSSFEGKQKLADQIKAQVEYVLGLRKVAPAIVSEQDGDEIAPADAYVIRTDIAEVLFTSFIIQ
jgi:flagellar FliL protein